MVTLTCYAVAILAAALVINETIRGYRVAMNR